MKGMNQYWNDEEVRRTAFPVVENSLFFAHAGVSALPKVAADALADFGRYGSLYVQEDDTIWASVAETRARAARLIGAHASEIALLGPTSLGLNLVANGWPWEKGDEVIFYHEDYPANVYPWAALKQKGVTPVPLKTKRRGEVVWEAVEELLTDRTRMVSLASCHYLTGFRIDIDGIGRRLRERGILFCLDGIQSLGAFPTSVEWVDFMSADSHKWMLGPVGAGIFYVRKEHHERLTPSLLGAWNVHSPDYVAQPDIRFQEGARRYEPGTLNIPGILAMNASMKLLESIGIDVIADRICRLKEYALIALKERGFAVPDVMEQVSSQHNSGIISILHETRDLKNIYKSISENKVQCSLRADVTGKAYLRFSPHFYNTDQEFDRLVKILDSL